MGTLRRRNKYGAKRTQVDGIWFDSKAEARRYGELKLLQTAGKIGPITVHPRYPIHHCGVKICEVVLDFSYHDYKRAEVFEDVKGKDNVLSKLKRKLVQAQYGFKVTVVKG